VAHLLLLARRRYDKAMLDDDAAELERAYDALRIALTLTPEPDLILNLAQVKRHLGACLEARALYARYLASTPTAAGATVAERHLLALGNCEDQPDSEPWPLLEAPAHQALRLLVPTPWSAFSEVVVLDTGGHGPPQPVPTSMLDVLPWGLAAGSLVSGALAAVFWLQADASRQRLSSSTDSQTALRAAEQGRSAQNAARLTGILAGVLGVSAGISFWLSVDAPEGASEAEALGSPLVSAHVSGHF
jgi:hypothetical protein